MKQRGPWARMMLKSSSSSYVRVWDVTFGVVQLPNVAPECENEYFGTSISLIDLNATCWGQKSYQSLITHSLKQRLKIDPNKAVGRCWGQSCWGQLRELHTPSCLHVHVFMQSEMWHFSRS